jgi:hypothetical protein
MLKDSREINPIIDAVIGMIQLRLGLSPNNIDMMLLTEEFIQHRATKQPVVPDASVRGWLFAQLPKLNEPNGLSVGFKDYLGKHYAVELRTLQEIPPLPPKESFQGYPDITYPFRERSIIERFAKKRSGDVLMVQP